MSPGDSTDRRIGVGAIAALAGKSVVITGAGRGLGAAYAELAAAEGASVVVNDVNAAAAQEVVDRIADAGGAAHAVVGDVSRWDEAERLVATCVSIYGRIDGLINNAGIERLGRAWEMSEADLTDLVRINVLGTMFCGTAAMRRMIKQGAGSIVNVTSGAHLGMAHLSAYGATKGAVAAVTHCWAVDLAATGVRANAISPLAVTPMSELTADYMTNYGMTRDGFLDGFPTPEENAPVVVYLLSERAAAVNGQIVRIGTDGLALLSHSLVLPGAAGRHNTVDAVAAAFDGVLLQQSRPPGPQ